ncbi:MAG: ABC transporter permease [Gemmatimonadetes bacterium]|nr:ABC transporter permease [Gemmatimonadota bacterium]
MFKHYFIIAVRNLTRYKSYALNNILGLTIGFACAISILLYVQNELSYDRYHEKADRIYRIVEGSDVKTQPLLGPALKEEFPEVERFLRIQGTAGIWLMAYEDRVFYETDVAWADETLCDLFSFPLLRGNPETALKDPFSVVISQSTAQKMFGDEDPMGKVIVADHGFADLRVTGVMADMPDNSHFKMDYFVSLSTSPLVGNPRALIRWSVRYFYTYLLLTEGHPGALLEDKLPAFVDKHMGGFLESTGGSFEPYLQRLTDIHLHSHLENELGVNGDSTYVAILLVVAGFVIVLTSVNFTNLSTARAMVRVREVGFRKVAGAQKWELIQQSIGETMLQAFCASILAVIIVWLVLPTFNDLSGKQLSLVMLDDPAYFIAWLGLTVLVGLLAGLYPAVFVSAIKPTGMLTGNQPVHRRQDYMRKGLVTVQCTISVALIVGTLVLHQQLGFLRNVKLGFEKEQVIVIPSGIRDIEESFPVLKQALLQHPGVLNVTDASSMPGVAGSQGFIHSMTAEVFEGVGAHRIDLGYIETGSDFVETLGIELLAGRSFHTGEQSNSDLGKVIINETATRALGWVTPEEAIGRQVMLNNEYKVDVVGVMKDFHVKSLHQSIRPLALLHYTYGTTFLAAKLSPDNLENTLDNIRETWASILPSFPLRYSFMSDDFDRLYQADRHFGQVCGIFTSIAAFIALQGLVGLASFGVGQRIREISIRKVLGASVSQVLVLLSREFVVLIVIANAIGWILAYYGLSFWLQQFAYRVDISADTFAMVGVLSLVVVMAVLGYHVIRTATSNLADVLRSG